MEKQETWIAIFTDCTALSPMRKCWSPIDIAFCMLSGFIIFSLECHEIFNVTLFTSLCLFFVLSTDNFLVKEKQKGFFQCSFECLKCLPVSLQRRKFATV